MAKPKGKIITEGRLSYGAAESATVVAVTSLGRFKLFKILFDKRDGSIYVPFPYMVTKRGLLSEIDPSAGADPHILELASNGVVVNYDVRAPEWVSRSKVAQEGGAWRSTGSPRCDLRL